METTEKLALINYLENHVENHLQQAIQKFQNLSNETLKKPSITGGWSVAECLEHLNKYGDYYLPLFEKKLSQSIDNQENIFIKSTWLGRKAISSMNPEIGTKKFRAFKDYVPTNQFDGKTTVAEFINHQERLLQILNIARTKDIQQIRIPISVAKFLKLNLNDALQFLIIHNERHIRQANRNLESN